MKRLILSSLLALVFCHVSLARAFDMTILHVNDTHSYLRATPDRITIDGTMTYVQLGGWTRLATAINEIRKDVPHTALLHAGDAVQGDLYFLRYDGKPEMLFLNRLGFDAMTLGNHEFDRGPEFLATLLNNTHVPILAANIAAPTIPRLMEHIQPYTILTYGTDKVGVIGVTTKDTSMTSSPGPGVTFADEAAAIRVHVNELQAKGINKIILLSHIGLERDKELAATIAGIDIIVGGHSHSLLGDTLALNRLGLHPADIYPMRTTGPDGSPVAIVTAWKWARILGRLDVSFDTDGHVIRAQGKPMLLIADNFQQKGANGIKAPLTGKKRRQVLDALAANQIATVLDEDSVSASFLAPYTQGLETLSKDVIGQAITDIPHTRTPGMTPSGINLTHGSLLAPLVAESMLAQLATTAKPADVALLNTGGVRDSLNQGDITIGTAYALMPFGNTLFVLTVPGKTIVTALEYGVTRGSGAFPAVAGARFTADMTRPEGSRISQIEIATPNGWEGLDRRKKYRLVTNAYLARGGDGYTMLKDVTERYDTGFVDAQAFIAYVRKRTNLSAPSSTGVTYIPAQ